MNVCFAILACLPPLAAVILAYLPGVLLAFIFSPRIDGFFCDDESIRLPKKPDSVTDQQLEIFIIASFFIVVIFCESLIGFLDYKNQNGQTQPDEKTHLNVEQSSSSDFSSSSSSFSSCFISTLKNIGQLTFYYMYGHSITFSTVYLIKVTVGRPRPIFLQVCQPVFPNQSTVCDDSAISRHAYIDNYACTNESSRFNELHDARNSFPSGHGAHSMFAAVFISMYLYECRGSNIYVTVAKMLVQSCLLMIGLYASVTRVPDHRHHASDVVAGMFIGVVLVLATMKHIGDKCSRANENLPV